jgi:hypothetical protein
MVEDGGRRQLEAKTDVETLAERARNLEGAGMLEEALWAWRRVLQIDGNYLPAWEASSRLLSAPLRQDDKATPR